jgi:Dolichyl-phosphate-mannose-protein mannosyltransferase
MHRVEVSSDGTISRARFVIGTLLLLCALLFYYFAVLKIDYRRTILFDLGLHPDADEYFAQARALGRTGAPFIRIGFEKLPSRYPPGYPFLMLPWLKLLSSSDQILAPFRTNQAVGILLLLGVFALYCRRKRPIDGGMTVLLIATLPAFVSFSRSSLSDLSAAVAVGTTFSLIYLGLQEHKRWIVYLAAIVLGLAFNIRMQLIFFAPILLAMALFPVHGSRWRWLVHCLGVLVLFFMAMSPTFILNYKMFGSPFRTGYDFWVPAVTAHPLFALRNVRPNLAMLWQEFTAHRTVFYVENIFGSGTSFVASFIVLGAAGIVMMPKGRFFICAALAATTFFLGTTAYFFKDARFYLPLLLLLPAAAQIPVGWALRHWKNRRYGIIADLIVLLFILACLGYPSQSGYPPKAGRVQSYDALHFADKPRRPVNFEAAQYFANTCATAPGLVLSDIDSVYLNALLGDAFAAAPIDQKHRYCYSWEWHYGKQDALNLVQRVLAQSEPEYALFVSAKERDENINRLPSIDGCGWSQLTGSAPSTAVIMRLTAKPPHH